MTTPMMATYATLQSLNPATGRVLAEFRPATESEVQRAVDIARQAAPGWRKLPIADRIRYLVRLKEILYVRRQEIAELITLEAGKPLVEALVAEVMLVLDTL